MILNLSVGMDIEGLYDSVMVVSMLNCYFTAVVVNMHECKEMCQYTFPEKHCC